MRINIANALHKEIETKTSTQNDKDNSEDSDGSAKFDDKKILYKSSYATVNAGKRRGPFKKKYSVDQYFDFATKTSIVDDEIPDIGGSLEDYFKFLPPVPEEMKQNMKNQRDRLTKSAINQSSSTVLERIDDSKN